jgi:cell division transport system ATP-binding protein
MALFDQLNRMGTTVLIATHNQAIMDKFTHKRLILDKGHLRIEEPKASGLRKRLEGVF